MPDMRGDLPSSAEKMVLVGRIEDFRSVISVPSIRLLLLRSSRDCEPLRRGGVSKPASFVPFCGSSARTLVPGELFG